MIRPTIDTFSFSASIIITVCCKMMENSLKEKKADHNFDRFLLTRFWIYSADSRTVGKTDCPVKRCVAVAVIAAQRGWDEIEQSTLFTSRESNHPLYIHYSLNWACIHHQIPYATNIVLSPLRHPYDVYYLTYHRKELLKTIRYSYNSDADNRTTPSGMFIRKGFISNE